MIDRYFELNQHQLQRFLFKCEKQYRLGEPLISDADFDALVTLFDRRSELKYENLIFQPCKYDIFLRTVRKTYVWENVIKFFRGIAKKNGDFLIRLELKLDGVALFLVYKFGRLFSIFSKGEKKTVVSVNKQLLICSNIPVYIEQFKQYEEDIIHH